MREFVKGMMDGFWFVIAGCALLFALVVVGMVASRPAEKPEETNPFVGARPSRLPQDTSEPKPEETDLSEVREAIDNAKITRMPAKQEQQGVMTVDLGAVIVKVEGKLDSDGHFTPNGTARLWRPLVDDKPFLEGNYRDGILYRAVYFPLQPQEREIDYQSRFEKYIVNQKLIQQGESDDATFNPDESSVPFSLD